ncbi:MAG: hypothetical protein ACKOOC_00875 [Cyanobium sp.]
MRTPLDSYAPEAENLHPVGPEGGGRFRWLQWLQLALTTALLVLFLNQLSQVQDANRRIARLYERMDALDRTRMVDSPELAAQQVMIIKRLQALESNLREDQLEKFGASKSSNEPAAFQPPTRP